MISCRVCCGATDNGKADCKEFNDRMIKKLDTNNVVVCGNSATTDATEDDFNRGRNNDVMYWSGHSGGSIDNHKLKSNGGYFDAVSIMKKWSTSNALKVLILAACYMLSKSSWANWKTIFGNTNLRVVCGYRKTAPAGSDSTPTDQKVVIRFFQKINDGKSIRTAWKYANQVTSKAKASWALISYGTSEANIYYRMPGWSTNSGAARSGGLWIYRQTNPLWQSLSTLMSKGLEFIDDDSYLEEVEIDDDP